jgi:hypothetical protein
VVYAAHVVYAQRSALRRRIGRGETCSDMRIDDQITIAAWVVEAEASLRDDTRVLQR